MKKIIYILSALVVLVIAFLVWFFNFYLAIPELKISTGMSQSEKIESVDKWFSDLQKKNKFNGVVLISKNGKVLLSKGYGYTDYRKNKMLTNESSLRLASVSKQFTAAGILLLVEKGKLKLSDKINSFIIDFPYEDVKIRDLLNQTSGIPDIYMELANKHRQSIDVLSNQLAIELLIDEQRKAIFNPGEKYQYSNTNYIILARLVEIIANRSFEKYMKEEIFDPLGMKNTRVWNLLSEESTFPNKADDMDNKFGNLSLIEPSFMDGVAGDGAVFTSAKDILIWDSFWYGNQLISQPILKQAFKKPKLLNGKVSDYGFGWVITENGMWHNGAWLGAKTIIMRNTNQKTCTAIFDNSSNLFFDKILKELSKLKQGDNKI